MSWYRKFSRPVMLAIIRRATGKDGKIRCERCGIWAKTRREFEIDHLLAERLRPDADQRRRLVPADGQLLCTAVCHPKKTRDDVGYIAEAKRREVRQPLPVAAGPTQIARRFGL